MDTEQVVMASGGYPLPCKGKFLATDELVAILSSNYPAVHQHIPEGVKENVYFLFDNERNVQRRERKQSSQFWDDCGAWGGGTTNTNYYLCAENQRLTELILKDNQYGTVYHKNTSAGRQRLFTPLPNQPYADAVLVLHKYYSKHSLSLNYKRRISWMSNNIGQKIAVAEYIGEFPGRGPHGLSKEKDRDYIRTKPTVMDKIKEEVQHQLPKQVGQELNDSDVVGDPRSRKQLRNARYRQKKKQQQEQQSEGHHANFADHVQSVASMVETHEFVQRVDIVKDKVPSVTLYIDDQVRDIRRFCCSAPVAHTTVLGFDETFNLGDVHATVGTFKHLAVTRRETNDHPIFIGPIFLHGNIDYPTYLSFFTHLAGKLRGTASQPIFRSDEKAIKQSIQTAFPESQHISCVQHLRQNVNDYLKDKIGVAQKGRTDIVESIFGADGISSADEDVIFEYRLQKTVDLCNDTASEFVQYFNNRVVPILRANFTAQTSLITLTSNNCESLNAVLKHAVDWKQQQLPALVIKLYDVVRSQYQDLRKSIVGQGDLVLGLPFKEFYVPIDVWSALSKEKRDHHFRQFMSCVWKQEPKTVVSIDDRICTVGPTNGGKKSGQVKRKKTA